ncbi:MAG TPA: hypothetical protein VGH28_11140 [Polyangiaceae bacterium]|jgi:hypothetical protein
MFERFCFLAVLATTSVGCTTTLIPNTTVADTSENRHVIQFCELYRHAMEDKDIGKLLALVSPRYHDDAGTPNGDDDTDYDTLKVFLGDRFQKTSDIRYEIKYHEVVFAENNHVYVNYKYSASYRVPTTHGNEWHHTVADNQLDLVPDGDSFKILAGM